MVDKSQFQDSTEERILQAAQEVFIKKGMDGTRMQEIADTAGINKSLLHYYYRTKQKLFEKVFKAAFRAFFPRVQKVMVSDAPLFDKIRKFVDEYYTLLMKNSYIPSFVIHELNKNPENVAELFHAVFEDHNYNRENMLQAFEEQLRKEVEKGVIKPVDARQLLVNVISMCIFPFVAKPILTGIMFSGDKTKYKKFLQERKETLAEFIIQSIKA